MVRRMIPLCGGRVFPGGKGPGPVGGLPGQTGRFGLR